MCCCFIPKKRLIVSVSALFLFYGLASEASNASKGEVEISLDDLDEPKKPAAPKGEVEINLDDLGEETAEAEEVAYLPVQTEIPEKEPNSLFMLFALGVLLPVGAMLLTPKRRSDKKKSVQKNG